MTNTADSKHIVRTTHRVGKGWEHNAAPDFPRGHIARLDKELNYAKVDANNLDVIPTELNLTRNFKVKMSSFLKGDGATDHISDYACYTDGSRLEERARAGWVIMDHGQASSGNRHLGLQATVFQAEMP